MPNPTSSPHAERRQRCDRRARRRAHRHRASALSHAAQRPELRRSHADRQPRPAADRRPRPVASRDRSPGRLRIRRLLHSRRDLPRPRRRPLAAPAIARWRSRLWSAMTALSGLAKSFVQLAIPRIFVGIGEATLTPSALSMLGDAFPRRRLGARYRRLLHRRAARHGDQPDRRQCRRAALRLARLLLPARRHRTSRRRSPCTSSASPSDAAAGLRARPPPAPGSPRCHRSGTCCATSCWRSPAAASSSSCCSAEPCSVTARGRRLLSVTWLVEERGYPYARAALLAGGMAVTRRNPRQPGGRSVRRLVRAPFPQRTALEPGGDDRLLHPDRPRSSTPSPRVRRSSFSAGS